MILVITPETIVPNESEIINQMFHEGLIYFISENHGSARRNE
jgi:hypothetical protein